MESKEITAKDAMKILWLNSRRRLYRRKL